MHIRGFFNYVYFKILEDDIYKELGKTEALCVGTDFATVRDNHRSFGKLDKSIEKFKRIFKENFSKEQYQRMIHQLNTLKIEEEYYEYEYSPQISLGTYNSQTNTITLNHYNGIDVEIDIEEVLFHELMHMASTNYSFSGEKTGFDLFGIIGNKLSEAYTEYLTRKYFTRGYKYTESKENGIYLVKGIENIVGSKKMESYFFKSDLKSLINDLAQYLGREDAIKLIYLIDREEDISFNSKDFRYLVRRIADINKMKLDSELEEGLISQRQYEEQYAIKVREYRIGAMWSEDTTVVGDETSFILVDHEYKSDVYTRENKKTPPQTFKKLAY